MVAAGAELRRCLQAFGRPFPTSRLEMWTCTMWQMTRQLLHRAWVGRCLATRSAGLFADVWAIFYTDINQFHKGKKEVTKNPVSQCFLTSGPFHKCCGSQFIVKCHNASTLEKYRTLLFYFLMHFIWKGSVVFSKSWKYSFYSHFLHKQLKVLN